MSLIDDCNELPSMENWLNAGAEWTEHHGIIEPTPSASAPLLFYGDADPSSSPGSAISLFEVKEDVITHPFLKLDAQEICKENPDALLVRNESPSKVLSEQQGNSVTMAPSTSSLLDRTPSLDGGASLYLEGDSPRGPLSPAALQLGKRSPIPVSNNKRPLVEDASDATSWMPVWDLQTSSRKSPKQQQQQNPVGYAPYVAMAAATPPLAMPTAAAPPTFLPVPAAAGNAAMAAPAILFPTPLTLPNVPSMEEIAQTRPKRRNVRISKDPTSVAARHRRERISDRVRVLQHFVPGGTKMDTASMLDEAIHYVKFLQQQLQILERLGNSYDPRFMTLEDPVVMPPGDHSVRPFDLNRACYPTFPSTSMAQPTSSSSSQQPLLPTWPTAKTTSPFCSQGFPDSAQEQFCH